jgi:hypothetical protein
MLRFDGKEKLNELMKKVEEEKDMNLRRRGREPVTD